MQRKRTATVTNGANRGLREQKELIPVTSRVMNKLKHLRKFLRVGGWQILCRPRVIANHFLNQREQRARAVVMKSLPSKVEIEISGKCNLRCRHCLRSYNHYLRPEEFIPLDAFETILKQLPYTVTLTLTGAGEPLLHPGFLKIVRRARELLPHLNIVVYTNFTLIEKTVTAQELVRSGVSQIHVSLDAASADVYRQVRGVDAWDHIVEGIKKLLEVRNELGARRPLVGTDFTMMRDNFRQAPMYVQLAHELGVDYIARPSLLMTSWGYSNGADGMTKSALCEVMHETRSIAKKLRAPMPLEAYVADPDGWFSHYEELRSHYFEDCMFFRNQIQIDAAGNFRLCCRHPRSPHTYGNLLEKPFRELWNGPVMISARRRQVAGEVPLPPCGEVCILPDPPLAP